MIDIRPFNSLGHANHGWLDARHHFSFGNYYDPGRMGWGSIRVWNDDKIAAKFGYTWHKSHGWVLFRSKNWQSEREARMAASDGMGADPAGRVILGR